MRPDRHLGRQRGAVVIELALVLGVFLLLMFSTIEIARLMYVFNTAQEVTRRAARSAALTDFSDGAAMAALRQHALFRTDAGALPLLADLTTERVRIEYLSMDASGALVPVAPLPACPLQNAANCTENQNGAACIRFVRASICAAGGPDCTALPYRLLTGFGPGMANLRVPTASTVVKAESLGYRPGVNTCL
ncbi:TadE/TadG family type IV pilus assembly protein [Pseudoduganella chitinolytica]|uniref:Pilus assembly protein n=1 Tax=Pseudoduganella chitinolytica TaxID=34070 RepID=A0ABY8BD95_9BURK|nr:TadE family protein [Pseudoduganella chitinolytica]WEF32319.1 pilus assembly protein [Pseudoduganella chitinolytica]